MITINPVPPSPAIRSLFAGWQETCIWSCLQGVMGRVYAQEGARPSWAAARLGDFCFLAGSPSRQAALVPVCEQGGGAEYVIMVPQTAGWAAVIEEVYGACASPFTRYATKKDTKGFDRGRLEQMAGRVPSGYEIRPIGRELFEQLKSLAWGRDLVRQYRDFGQFSRLGLGFAALCLADGKPAAGASSYSSYLGGVEIEIDTQKEHQRRGLARACGARMILSCLERGLYPSWDAHNRASLSLALSLGYELDYEYPAYEVFPGPSAAYGLIPSGRL